MRIEDLEESQNVEDRRGRRPSGGRLAAGGGIGTIILALLFLALGGNPADIFSQESGSAPYTEGAGSGPIDDEGKRFVSKVLKETEDVWNKIFAERGAQYQEPKLVVFSGQVESACGLADTAVGPFYCPADSQVYIDLEFFDTMKKQLGAGGDFAQAYVVAHEVGHHVQNLLGTAEKVDKARKRSSEKQANALTVRMELQADFYAGVWAHHAKDLKIDRQDIEEALNAAHQIGDDTLQRKSQGFVVPDSFTHGTSEQRMRWFLKGYESGDISLGDTFSAKNL